MVSTDKQPPARWAAPETPFEPPGVCVKPEWIDYNGHMNVGYYHVAFDDASTPFFTGWASRPSIDRIIR